MNRSNPINSLQPKNGPSKEIQLGQPDLSIVADTKKCIEGETTTHGSTHTILIQNSIVAKPIPIPSDGFDSLEKSNKEAYKTQQDKHLEQEKSIECNKE